MSNNKSKMSHSGWEFPFDSFLSFNGRIISNVERRGRGDNGNFSKVNFSKGGRVSEFNKIIIIVIGFKIQFFESRRKRGGIVTMDERKRSERRERRQVKRFKTIIIRYLTHHHLDQIKKRNKKEKKKRKRKHATLFIPPLFHSFNY